MERLIITLTLLSAALCAAADNWFTVGDDDTLELAADRDTVTVNVKAHFDGRLDFWQILMDWPEGITAIEGVPGPGMSINYMNRYAEEATLDVPLAFMAQNQDSITAGAFSGSTPGYWDYNHDGQLESYGFVKWEAGDFEQMFFVTLVKSRDFAGGRAKFSGYVNCCGVDLRGGTIGGNYIPVNRTVTIKVTGQRGDVNCDGRVNISDVTTLINQLLEGSTTGMGDVDGDGHVGIADVTALINQLLAGGGN